MAVAVVAVFLSLAGAGYAAVSIPAGSVTNAMLANNSVGIAKMRNNAVGFKQIVPGSVGAVRIDKQQIQQTVKSGCTSGGQAITAIAETGTVTCGTTASPEFDSGAGQNVSVTSATTAASVASFSLSSGSTYLLTADPYVQVTPDAAATGAENVVVSCTLASTGASAATQTRNASVAVTGGSTNNGYVSIPLTVTAPSTTASQTASVTCTRTVDNGTPTVTTQATIYALPTASNTSA